MKAKNIKWDIEEDKLPQEELKVLREYPPTEIDIPDDIDKAGEIADWLSDTYGYCIYNFEIAKE